MDHKSLAVQKVPNGFTHANYIFAPVVKDENKTPQDFIPILKEKGISSRTIYDIPAYKQDTYLNIKNWRWAKFVDYPDYSSDSHPRTEKIAQSHFEVPIHQAVTKEDAEHIAEVLNSIG